MFDEMKIKCNLVYDKVSGELIGFVDLGDPAVNVLALEDANQLATHALVFIVQGLATKLCYYLGYFATRDATAFQIFPLFWEAVGILDLTVNLWVIACCCDGTSPHQRFFRMHSEFDGNTNRDVVYRTLNFYSPDSYIYFFFRCPSFS